MVGSSALIARLSSQSLTGIPASSRAEAGRPGAYDIASDECSGVAYECRERFDVKEILPDRVQELVAVSTQMLCPTEVML